MVVNAATKSPISGATVGVREKKIFSATGTDGRFELMYARITVKDTLTISCLGYKTQRMVIRNIKQPLVTSMEPFFTQLAEVRIGRPLLEVGSKYKTHALTGSFFPDTDAAMFMKGSTGKKGIIQSVGFYISEGHISGKGDAKAPFRIKIFDVSDDGSPGKELTDDVIVTRANQNNEWFDIDLSLYGIKTSKRGFFVCFSLLNSDYYLLGQAYKKDPLITKSIDVITPRLGVTTDEYAEHLCFFRNNKGIYDGVWTRHIFNSNYMIRATIKLSK